MRMERIDDGCPIGQGGPVAVCELADFTGAKAANSDHDRDQSAAFLHRHLHPQKRPTWPSIEVVVWPRGRSDHLTWGSRSRTSTLAASEHSVLGGQDRSPRRRRGNGETPEADPCVQRSRDRTARGEPEDRVEHPAEPGPHRRRLVRVRAPHQVTASSTTWVVLPVISVLGGRLPR